MRIFSLVVSIWCAAFLGWDIYWLTRPHQTTWIFAVCIPVMVVLLVINLVRVLSDKGWD